MMSSRRLKALLVTPNFPVAEQIGKKLNDSASTFDVAHVQWLSAALKRLVTERFDVVLLSLSVLDGAFAGLNQIHASLPDAPVLVIASAADQAEALSAIQHGADDCFFIENFEAQSLRQNVLNAIHRTQLLKDIRADSYEDSVTGMYNLDGFESAARRFFSSCRRPGSKVYVIMLSVRGAAVSIVTSIAEALKTICRKSGAVPRPCVSRVGPDEFAVLATEDSLADVRGLVNRSEETLGALVDQNREAGRWSVAVGMAAYDPEYPSSPAAVLERARQSSQPAKPQTVIAS